MTGATKSENLGEILPQMIGRRPLWEWGHCERADFDNEDDDSLARAVDGSQYYAILRTHHTFGCVQYKPDPTTRSCVK